MSNEIKAIAKVMTIATSDSGSGAGIQADLKTFAAHGCYGTSVFVALTAQNTQKVTSIFPVEPDFVVEQFNTVMQDIGTDVIKIGMLHRLPIIKTLIDLLLPIYKDIPIILDPVMISETGYLLLEEDAVNLLLKKLFPLATLVTPNLEETQWLLGKEITSLSDIEQAAIAIAKCYQVNVLIKGGHLTGENCADYYYAVDEEKGEWFEHRRIDTKNLHGTGCTLSSAIAANLAKKQPLSLAIGNAIQYLESALQSGRDYQIGKGAGPVDHFAKASLPFAKEFL